MALGNFEQLCKMTRLGPEPLSTISGPPPVKFRPVYYNPTLDEEENNQPQSSSSDEFEMDEDILHADLPFNGNYFYKDPLYPSYDKADEMSTAEEESSSSSLNPNKLGRNMRACGSKSVKNADKTVWAQMAARKQLLDEQKQQHLKHSKRETTDREATALVNNLIQQGFHITPPDTTPRVADTRRHTGDLSDAESEVISVTSSVRHEGNLIRSIHKELKRVQGIEHQQSSAITAAECL